MWLQRHTVQCQVLYSAAYPKGFLGLGGHLESRFSSKDKRGADAGGWDQEAGMLVGTDGVALSAD